MKYLEAEHPGLYEKLILNRSLCRYLAAANEKAKTMMEQLTESDGQAGWRYRTVESRAAHGLGQQNEQRPQQSRRNYSG